MEARVIAKKSPFGVVSEMRCLKDCRLLGVQEENANMVSRHWPVKLVGLLSCLGVSQQ